MKEEHQQAERAERRVISVDFCRINNFRFCRCSTCCLSTSYFFFFVTSFNRCERALAQVWILHIFHLHFSFSAAAATPRKIRWTYRKSREHFIDLFFLRSRSYNFSTRRRVVSLSFFRYFFPPLSLSANIRPALDRWKRFNKIESSKVSSGRRASELRVWSVPSDVFRQGHHHQQRVHEKTTGTCYCRWRS